MDGGHDLAPELRGGVAAEVDALGRVETGPDHGHVIRRAAGEPAVLVIAGGAGLAGHGHAVKPGLLAGALFDALLHHPGHAVGGIGGEGVDGLGLVVEHDVALRVGHHGVGAALGKHAVVHEGAVGGGHLAHGDAVGQLAEGHGGVGRVVRHQAGEAEALGQVIVGGLRRELVDDLGGHGVERPLERGVDRDQAVVFIAVVVGIPVGAAQVDVGRVVDGGVRGDEPLVDGRGVGGQRLDGRAGGAGRAAVVEAVHGDGDRAVELKAAGLLADAALQRQDAPVVGVHDDDGALQLLGAAGAGEVGGVLVNGVRDRLDVGVLAAVDLIARVEQQGARGLLADALGLHEIPHHVVDDDFFVVGIDLVAVLAARGIGEDQLFGHRVLPGLVVDVALLVHLAQDDLLPLLVVLLVIEGIVVSGLVGDADDGGRLGQRQLRHVLAEVGVRRRLHAVAALSEVHGVEIPFHDLLLVVLLLQLQRAEDLGQLALDRDLVLAGQVLDELLGDGGAAGAGLHAGEHLHEGTGGAVPVHALVLVEALVLDGDQRLLHIFGDLVDIRPDALVVAHQGLELLPLAGGVLVPDGAGLGELVVLQRQVHVRGQEVLHIVGEDAGEQEPRDQQNQQEGAEHLKDGADDGRGDVHREAGGLEGHAQPLGRTGVLFILFHRVRCTSSAFLSMDKAETV